jgi:hypothetical protein
LGIPPGTSQLIQNTAFLSFEAGSMELPSFVIVNPVRMHIPLTLGRSQ